MGGGGFSADGVRSPLDERFVALARERRGTDRPRICFVGTASGDDAGYRDRFHMAYDAVAETSHLTLFTRDVEDIPAFVARQDAVYVGGGNTASLLAVWRAHGLDRALRVAHDDGIVLGGVSAGSICWFESGTTDSYGPTLQPVDGALGFIPGSHSPHYDGEKDRRPLYQQLIASGKMKPGYACDNNAGIYFEDNEVKRVVASRAGAKAYYVSVVNGKAVERVLEPEMIK